MMTVLSERAKWGNDQNMLLFPTQLMVYEKEKCFCGGGIRALRYYLQEKF